MGYGRLTLTLALLLLLFSLSLWGLTVSDRWSHERAEARRQVSAALAERDPDRAAWLFRQARAFDDVYGACETGQLLEEKGLFAEAAESFRACRNGDPGLAAVHLLWAEARLRTEAPPAYPGLQAHLRQVRETFRRVPSADPELLQAMEDLILDLDALMDPDGTKDHSEAWTVEELVEILSRGYSRGLSRYEGPRVPLRLGFRPGEATLGRAAEGQLQDVVQALRHGRLAQAVLRIEGHTDSAESASEADRVTLGRRRAEAVRNFLIRAGIPRQRLRITSLAGKYPLDSNGTLAGRDANRRVELFNLDENAPVWGDVRKRR